MARPRRMAWGLGALIALIAGSPLAADDPPAKRDARPNFLIIVADDLGYSDLGFMGSEIPTPHLDALAAEGLLLTGFHVTPTCSPTRAALLTGLDPHRAGLGTMRNQAAPEQAGRPGYEGVLAPDVLTIAERLGAVGYASYLSGKWHLGDAPGQRPTDRGFDRAFGPIGGGASHFSDQLAMFAAEGPPGKALFLDDGAPAAPLPDEWFSTDGFTDRLIGQIESGRQDGRPFLALATYTAPHWPLQAPEAWIDRFEGAYDDGWDVLRETRMEGLRRSGRVPPDTPTPARLPFVPAWDSLDEAQQRRAARTMEVYAAMVAHLDHAVGRLLAYLEQSGQRDDTLVFFFPDNGAEGNPVNRIVPDWGWVERTFDNRLENIGRPGSYVFTGPGWAQASALPFHLFKAFPTQGGIQVPAIIAGARTAPGRENDAFATVMDLVPTLLELADAPVIDPADDRSSVPLAGRSLVPLIEGGADRVHGPSTVTGWELFGRRAVRVGDWKAQWLYAPYGPARWQLFDLATDPFETRDLAAGQPERLAGLIDAWSTYAREQRVVLPAEDAGYAREDDWRAGTPAAPDTREDPEHKAQKEEFP